jgi:glycosyltransferase involved in cell wall biosynthesis
MKITGVLPVHNGEKFIDKSIPLILSNLNFDDELLIINNGSTDCSDKKLEIWSKMDSRINLITTKTPGLVNALNLGIEESCNNWIARFDIDDSYETDRLKHQRASLSEKTIAVFTDYDFFSDSDNYLGTIPSALDADAVAVSLISSQRTAHPSVLFSKEAVLNAGGYRDIDFPAEDLSLWLRMSRLGDLISIPKTLLHYRLSTGSITGTKRNEAKEITKKLLIDIGINQKKAISLIENFESVIELYKNNNYARVRELLILKDLYHLSNNGRLETKLRKKTNQLLIQFIPKHTLNIPNLQAVKLLRKEQILRNKVRQNLL